VPGRVVIGPSIAPRLPSQHCGQCRHHQHYLRASNHRSCSGACSRDLQTTTSPGHQPERLYDEILRRSRPDSHAHPGSQLCEGKRISACLFPNYWLMR
jgi:hypothetical protein